MVDTPRLYNTCLRKVALLMSEGIWTANDKSNCFCFLPAKIVDDLTSTALEIQKPGDFKTDNLELLLTSGRLREFKLYASTSFRNLNADQMRRKFNEQEHEIARALKSLASASQNLEVIHLFGTFGGHYLPNNKYYQESSELSEALQQLLSNSPNLKHIHCKAEFDLKALRNCKKLQSIMLHFNPKQPWYSFLEQERENADILQPLNSLEIFTICETYSEGSPWLESQYIEVLLRHCPSLTSLGFLETSRALAQINRKGILPQVKLRRCRWDDSENFHGESEWIRDAVEYHPFVEELNFSIQSTKSITYLGRLRNLVFLNIWLTVKNNVSELLGNSLKDIGVQLKHLSMWFENPLDISTVLKNCPNLEALGILTTSFTVFAEPVVTLQHLKYLTLHGYVPEGQTRVLSLFSGCHNLTELFMTGAYNDEDIEKFVKKNSLSNLKVAYFESCDLTKCGFKEFLLNAPQLEKIEAVSFKLGEPDERNLKSALLETDHKAIYKRFLVTKTQEFFHKKLDCNLLY